MLFRSPLIAQNCMTELEILSKINNKNIVKLKQVVSSKNSVYLIMDYVSVNLRELIESEEQLTHEQVKFIIYQILQAINYLHSTKIVHRNIKPENILIGKDLLIKLWDFRFARKISDAEITSNDLAERHQQEITDLKNQYEISEETIDIEEDLDEHVSVNYNLSMPDHFKVCKVYRAESVKITDDISLDQIGRAHV